MSLKFCPKCQSILMPEKIGDKEFLLKCAHCGYSEKFKGKSMIEKEKIFRKGKTGDRILKNENEFATYKHKCPKCGHNKAQVIDVGIFYSDEDNLILLKCGKCGWSERIGKKTA